MEHSEPPPTCGRRWLTDQRLECLRPPHIEGRCFGAHDGKGYWFTPRAVRLDGPHVNRKLWPLLARYDLAGLCW